MGHNRIFARSTVIPTRFWEQELAWLFEVAALDQLRLRLMT
jgi:hypothetical protein